MAINPSMMLEKVLRISDSMTNISNKKKDINVPHNMIWNLHIRHLSFLLSFLHSTSLRLTSAMISRLDCLLLFFFRFFMSPVFLSQFVYIDNSDNCKYLVYPTFPFIISFQFRTASMAHWQQQIPHTINQYTNTAVILNNRLFRILFTCFPMTQKKNNIIPHNTNVCTLHSIVMNISLAAMSKSGKADV